MRLASASDTARALDLGAPRRHLSSMNIETQEKEKFRGLVPERCWRSLEYERKPRENPETKHEPVEIVTPEETTSE